MPLAHEVTDPFALLPFLRREPREGTAGPSPVLVLLHGHGKFRNHLFDLTGGVNPRLTVLGVQAPVRMGPGAYRWFDYTYAVDGTVTISAAEEASSYVVLVEFLEALVEAGGDKIYLLGHSQGGMMALSVALARPDLVTGCAVLNARVLPQALKRMTDRQVRRPPVFIGHGIEDETVPINRGRTTRDILARLGAGYFYREYPAGHDITPAMLADVSAWLTDQLDRNLPGPRRSCPFQPFNHTEDG